MKKIVLTAMFLLLAGLCVYLSSVSQKPKLQFFIDGRLVAEISVLGKRFYRAGSKGVYLILERSEGLRLLANTIESPPKKGDLMEIKFNGQLMSSRKSVKDEKEFSSVLASAFPPQIVSVHFETKEDLEGAICDYLWREEKDFSFNALERIPNLDPSSSLELIETLNSQIDLNLFLFEERKRVFLEFLGWEDINEPLKDDGYREYIEGLLSGYAEPTSTGGVRMPNIGTWFE